MKILRRVGRFAPLLRRKPGAVGTSPVGFLLAAAVLLSACQTPGTVGPITQELATKGYGKYTITWSGTFEGSKTELFFRLFEKEGKLAVCGYYFKSSGQDQQLNSTWIERAKIYLDDTEIVTTRFLNPVEKGKKPRANCVTTTVPFSPQLKTKKFRLKGNDVILYS